MKGLRTQESDKFNRFFKLIQQEAEKTDCIFFADAGDGHELITDTLECEDMMGWLIPKSMAKEFEPMWKRYQVPHQSWTDFYTFAIWEKDGNTIKIKFEE